MNLFKTHASQHLNSRVLVLFQIRAEVQLQRNDMLEYPRVLQILNLFFISTTSYFSMHYAASVVMVAWLDTYFFVWPQNGDAFVFYNRLLL